MRLLTTIRLRQLRASRLVAAVFAIAWFGLAAAPCQASPDLEHSGTSHHGSMPADDCGHCPAAASDLDEGCATVAAPDCLSQGPALLERRDVEIPQPPAGPPPGFFSIAAFVPDGGLVQDARARRLLVSHVSVQQRYCTYLK